MPPATGDNLLAAVLDSWDRNNRILVNLLRALPPGALDARVMPTSPSVSEMFMHMVYVRLVIRLRGRNPITALRCRRANGCVESDPGRIAAGLDNSARGRGAAV